MKTNNSSKAVPLYLTVIYAPTETDPQIYVNTVERSDVSEGVPELHHHVSIRYRASNYSAHIYAVNSAETYNRTATTKLETQILQQLNEMQPPGKADNPCPGCRLRLLKSSNAFIKETRRHWVSIDIISYFFSRSIIPFGWIDRRKSRNIRPDREKE